MGKNDGGPAFPAKGAYRRIEDSGMSLRDWFAGMAMQGLLASQAPDYSMRDEQIVSRAYTAADMMLAEREKQDV